MKKLLFAAAAFLLAVTPQFARAGGNYSIQVKNDSNNAIWVTTYVASNRRSGIIKAQCVPGGTAASVQSQSDEPGGWVLFELKESKTSCADHSNIGVVEKNVKHYITFSTAGNRTVNFSQ